MSAPKRVSLRKYLSELDAEALREEIERIVERFPEVKKFYLADLSGDTSKLLGSAKTQLDKAFRDKNGNWRCPKASKLNEIVRDFEKVSVFREDVLELLLYRIRLSVDFTLLSEEYRYMSFPAFENSMLVALGRLCKLAKDYQALDKYLPQLEEMQLQLEGYSLPREFAETIRKATEPEQ